jgi:hypothetical protein
LYKFNSNAAVEAGLRLWIAFILGFWFAGLRAELCIFLGAIGGLATWQLVSFWQAEKVDKPSASPQPSPAPEVPLIGPLGQVFLKPAERFRNLGAGRRLPRLPKRKPPRRL